MKLYVLYKTIALADKCDLALAADQNAFNLIADCSNKDKPVPFTGPLLTFPNHKECEEFSKGTLNTCSQVGTFECYYQPINGLILT